jgi:hypothetical protein
MNDSSETLPNPVVILKSSYKSLNHSILVLPLAVLHIKRLDETAST